MVNDYIEIIEKAAKKYGLDVWFIRAIIEAESSGDPNAVSPVGAIGLMQIMPATGRIDLGLTEKELLDPYKNIMGGCEYLVMIRKWLQKGSFQKKLMLAAYNGGIGNVWKHVGIPPFEETQKYVAKIMKNKP